MQTAQGLAPSVGLAEKIEQALLFLWCVTPARVLRVAKAMNGSLNRVLLIGCELATLGGDEGAMGLSGPVKSALGYRCKALPSFNPASGIDGLLRFRPIFSQGFVAITQCPYASDRKSGSGHSKSFYFCIPKQSKTDDQSYLLK
jgi:hypothetical protein